MQAVKPPRVDAITPERFARYLEEARAELHQLLHSYGISATPLRIAILGYLSLEHANPTPDEIAEQLTRLKFPLSVSSVYLTLREMLRNGLVLPIPAHSADRPSGLTATHYDLAVYQHAHLICHSCGRIEDVPLEEFGLSAEQVDRATEPRDFHPSGFRLNVYGLCSRCILDPK